MYISLIFSLFDIKSFIKNIKVDSINLETEQIINNLLTRSYYDSYNELDENTINFVILKILHIIDSINNVELLNSFNKSIQILANDDPNLEIRDFSKKVYKRLK